MNEYFEGIDSIKFEVVRNDGMVEPQEEYKRCVIEKGGFMGIGEGKNNHLSFISALADHSNQIESNTKSITKETGDKFPF